MKKLQVGSSKGTSGRVVIAKNVWKRAKEKATQESCVNIKILGVIY